MKITTPAGKVRRPSRYRKRVVVGTIVVMMIIYLVLHFSCFLARAIKTAVTVNREARILAALGKALGRKPFAEYDLTAEILGYFPEASLKNGKIIDAWGSPVTMKIERVENEIFVWIRSAGPDGKMGTKDDVVKGLAWVDEPDLLETIEEGVVWDGPLALGVHGSFSTNAVKPSTTPSGHQ
ncbi:MAG: hypothetical protein FWG50_12335 [Kiritimatiellaeota bacterium]|nr:hypothetical protein [Kiritimatiellota bacterium]